MPPQSRASDRAKGVMAPPKVLRQLFKLRIDGVAGADRSQCQQTQNKYMEEERLSSRAAFHPIVCSNSVDPEQSPLVGDPSLRDIKARTDKKGVRESVRLR